MGLRRRRQAATTTDPTQVTVSVTLTGKCRRGHPLSYSTTVTAKLGSMGTVSSEITCSCGALADLTGSVG